VLKSPRWSRTFPNPSTACGGIFDYDAAKRRLAELTAQAENPDLWQDPETAQKILRERTRLEERIATLDTLRASLEDQTAYLELGEAEGDADVIGEAERAIEALRRDASRAELATLLSGEADANDCYLEVHAGAGGTEAQDWAEMLLRMYVRWAERRRYKVEWIEESPGEEAGIKSATVRISGRDAFGWAKTESGVHRLVRTSPFDASGRRHTSFASVAVYPVVDDSITIDILDKDLRIDTYRASGAGGQHVNRTD
jgi:peptide chain release factor 2